MPAFLRSNGFKNPTDQNHTVWQVAHSCTENCYEWMMTHPENFEQLNLYMMARSEGSISAFDRWTPDSTGLSPERAVFVDIGGAIGVKCVEFKEKFPNIPGKVILQDLPFAVEHALPTNGVEKMVYDFLTPQPIKGTKPLSYYITEY
jgi:demethylsterigmatocystin 6-O-methyltransferase